MTLVPSLSARCAINIQNWQKFIFGMMLDTQAVKLTNERKGVKYDTRKMESK